MANESEGVLDVLREWRDMVCYSKGPVHPLCHGGYGNVAQDLVILDQVILAHARSVGLGSHGNAPEFQIFVQVGERGGFGIANVQEGVCLI